MAVRKRGDQVTDKAGPVAPPSEAWLLRTLAELRREQAHPFTPVPRPKKVVVR